MVNLSILLKDMDSFLKTNRFLTIRGHIPIAKNKIDSKYSILKSCSEGLFGNNVVELLFRY